MGKKRCSQGLFLVKKPRKVVLRCRYRKRVRASSRKVAPFLGKHNDLFGKRAHRMCQEMPVVFLIIRIFCPKYACFSFIPVLLSRKSALECVFFIDCPLGKELFYVHFERDRVGFCYILSGWKTSSSVGRFCRDVVRTTVALIVTTVGFMQDRLLLRCRFVCLVRQWGRGDLFRWSMIFWILSFNP